MPNYTDTWIIIWIITNYIKNSIISVCYGGLMSMFSSMLGSEESLFRDPIPLDYDYMPKLVPYREKQQQQIALCIKPLLAERNGRNILIHYGEKHIQGITDLFRQDGWEVCDITYLNPLDFNIV